MRRLVAMPSAPARRRFSRIAASASPNGDCAQPARHGEQEEQHGETVERRVALAGEADRKQAEHRPIEKLSPSAPPVSQRVAVGELAEHQRDAERHHQPGQVGAAQQQRRGREADDGAPTAAPATSPSVGSAKPWLARIAAA